MPRPKEQKWVPIDFNKYVEVQTQVVAERLESLTGIDLDTELIDAKTVRQLVESRCLVRFIDEAIQSDESRFFVLRDQSSRELYWVQFRPSQDES